MSKKSQQIKSQLKKVGGKLSSSELDKIKEKLNISGGIRPIVKDLGIKTFGEEGKTQKIKSQLKKVDGELSFSELDKIKEKLNISGGIRPIAKDLEIKIAGGGGKTNVPKFGDSSEDEGMYAANFKHQAQLNFINAQGNIDTQIANLHAESAKNIAKINQNTAILGGLVSAFNF